VTAKNQLKRGSPSPPEERRSDNSGEEDEEESSMGTRKQSSREGKPTHHFLGG